VGTALAGGTRDVAVHFDSSTDGGAADCCLADARERIRELFLFKAAADFQGGKLDA
jgi:hypothetical protein